MASERRCSECGGPLGVKVKWVRRGNEVVALCRECLPKPVRVHAVRVH